MFKVLLSLLFALFLIGPAQAEGFNPGEEGYKHKELHLHYQKVFDQAKCHCSSGQCRATVWRVGNSGGYEVLVDGEWLPVPNSAFVSGVEVAVELQVDPAHVCVSHGKVECVIINLGA